VKKYFPRKARPKGRAFFFMFLAVLTLNGCASATDVLKDRDEIAAAVAQSAGFTRFFVDTGQFELVGYRRFSNASVDEVSVYVEGDGLAFLSANVVSRDPTPRDPVSLRLAAVDKSPNVAYLSRPCHYQTPDRLARCKYAYWTTSRFGPIVIKEMNTAVDAIKQASGAAFVRLYGYSGGGVVAALIAARRSDVSSLVTVAAPLDHREWTRLKRFTPLAQSLNPMDVAGQTVGVPQTHFVGKDDSVVPRSTIDRFAAKVRAQGGKADVVSVPNTGHRCCWQDRWPDLYNFPAQ
jgi:hypothetical protein